MKHTFAIALFTLISVSTLSATEAFRVNTPMHNTGCATFDANIDAKFSNNEVVLSAYAAVTIYSSNGLVIFKNDNVKIIDCKDWQHDTYTLVFSNGKKFQFSI